MTIRTSTIASLLQRTPHVVDHDTRHFADVAGLRGATPHDDVSMRWVRKHTLGFGEVPERRVWLCGFAQWRGKPFALVQRAGKQGNEDSLKVFDASGYTAAARAMTDSCTIRVPPIVMVTWNFHDAGMMYGMCVDCDWDRTHLDRWVMGYCLRCCPGEHVVNARLGIELTDFKNAAGRVVAG